MRILFSIIFCLSLSAAFAQTKKDLSVADSHKLVQVVDVACGECQFGLKGKDCRLAIRTAGKAYFVEGTSIDEHGDAHAPDGFCQAVRKAEVQGSIVNNKFAVTYFKLLPTKN